MKFTLTIIDWQARAPGLSDADAWQAWSRQSDAIDPAAPLAKLTDLPMMTARRLNSGSKLAVDIGLAMLRKHRIDAVVYSSRHGELERNYRILQALAARQLNRHMQQQLTSGLQSLSGMKDASALS